MFLRSGSISSNACVPLVIPAKVGIQEHRVRRETRSAKEGNHHPIESTHDMVYLAVSVHVLDALAHAVMLARISRKVLRPRDVCEVF
jgi:predicted membrane-bound mannosyltransferase